MKKEGFKMEESDDKPFQCTAPGCGQRFANNDHLERHKQKHQLTLKFGSLKGTDLSVADQTPTPTRFLRNCEEEGLFQDLENPFDQDFKRASEQPSSSSSAHHTAHQLPSDHSHTSIASNTTVPTPSVIVIDDSEGKVEIVSPPQNTTTTEPKKSVIAAAPVSVLVRVPPHIPPAIPASIAAPNAQVPSALPVPSHIHGRLNSVSSSMPIPSIPTPAIVSSPGASSPPSFVGSAKQRLKEQLKLHQAAAQSNNIIHRAMTEAVDMVTSQHNGIPSPGNHINHSHQSTIMANSSMAAHDAKRSSGNAKRPRRTHDELDPDERRKRFLERNRAAATRCREKRKIWVQQLEKKADDLSTTNAHLQNEITLLRTEVAQLKSLLLAHKDCPVTIAQQRNSQMLNHQVAEQTNGVITSNSTHTDAASAEDVATSALTQMAHRATLELENLAATTMSSVSNPQGVITTSSNPIGV